MQEGDAVATGDVIGLVEVMKTYYELKADQDGIADRFLIEDAARSMRATTCSAARRLSRHLRQGAIMRLRRQEPEVWT